MEGQTAAHTAESASFEAEGKLGETVTASGTWFLRQVSRVFIRVDAINSLGS